MAIYGLDIHVAFGDCDPAGIVYYPNFFSWVDRVFHALLRDKLGGHGPLSKSLGIKGIGLMKSEMTFRSPALENQLMRVELTDIEWSEKSFRLNYKSWIGERLVFEGVETRCLFAENEGRIQAGAVEPFKAAYDQAMQA